MKVNKGKERKRLNTFVCSDYGIAVAEVSKVPFRSDVSHYALHHPFLDILLVHSWLHIRHQLYFSVTDILTCPWSYSKSKRLFTTCGLCVTFTAPTATEWTPWQRHSALCLQVCRYFRVTAAARPVLVRAFQKETMPCQTKVILLSTLKPKNIVLPILSHSVSFFLETLFSYDQKPVALENSGD